MTFFVCTRVSASNSSSSVPKPPGRHTKACEYLTNIVLRAKKYRKLMPRSTHSLRPCSNGSSMPSPTDSPPASWQPRFAASIMPGPPPVITAKLSRASAAPSSRPSAYSLCSRGVRAEPNTVTARGSSASMPKPSTNSAWIRSTRHGSVCTQSLCPRESSSRWSVVLDSLRCWRAQHHRAAPLLPRLLPAGSLLVRSSGGGVVHVVHVVTVVRR